MARQFAVNISSRVTSTTVAKLLVFAATIVMARAIGADGLGRLSFAAALVSYLGIASAGFDTAGTRRISRGDADPDEAVGEVLVLRLLFVLGAILAIGAALPFVGTSAQMRWISMLLALGLASRAVGVEWAFLGIQRLEMVAIADLLGAALFSAVVIAVSLTSGSLVLLAMATALSQAARELLLIAVFWRKQAIRPRFSLVRARTLTREALPLASSVFLTTLYFNIDSLILGFSRGTHDVGTYAASYKIVVFLIGLVAIYSSTIMPVLTRVHRAEPHRTRPLVSEAVGIISGVALPVGIGGTFLAPGAIRVLFGGEYEAAVLPFRILIWSPVLMLVGATYWSLILATGRDRIYVFGVALAAAANIALNLLLIPPFGPAAAAATTVASEAIVVIWMAAFSARAFGNVLPPPGRMLRVAASCLVMAIVLGTFGRTTSLPVAIVSGAVSYLLAVLGFGAVQRSDIDRLSGARSARSTRPGAATG